MISLEIEKTKLRPSEFFTKSFRPKAVEAEFNRKLALRNTKGIDKISLSKFEEKKNENIKIISQKCLKGKYKFSPYLEKLKLKGRDKIPRVISVATIRDKVVLSILKEVLHFSFPECINSKLPNAYIRDIRSFHYDKSLEEVRFLKVDIEKFFDKINHDKLHSILRKRIRSKKILTLIESAIINPTVGVGYKKADRFKLKNTKGVPQGLSISNILANIYLSEFDKNLESSEFRYIRYVDDILTISSLLTHSELLNIVNTEIQKLDLSLHKSKKEEGYLSEEFEYLGYKFKNNIVSVRQSTVNIFIHKIAAKFTWLNYNLNDPRVKSSKIKGPEEYKNRFIDILNEKITGAIDEKKKYGWIFYFIEINDLHLLYHLDQIINNFFKRQKAFGFKKPPNVKSFVKSYYQARHNPLGGYIHNYNSYDTTEKKENLLLRYGLIDPDLFYSPAEINIIFNKVKFDNILELDLDIGVLY